MKYKEINIEGIKNIGKTTTCVVLRKSLKDLNKDVIVTDDSGFGTTIANKLANGESLKDLEFTQTNIIQEYEKLNALTIFLLPYKDNMPKRVIMTPYELSKEKYMQLIPNFFFNKKLNFSVVYIEEGDKILEIVGRILKLLEKK